MFICFWPLASPGLFPGWVGLVSHCTNPASGYTLPPQVKGQAVAAALK